MEKQKLVTIGIIALVLLVAGAVIIFKSGLAVQNTDVSEEVAKYIGEHSVLYMRTTCPHCVDQEKMFGENVKYLNMIDGDKAENVQKFIDAGVTEVPTWIINNQKYVGVQSIEKLKELTGYQGK